ncbi:MAG: DUF896 domain-containing protein [Clostridia bacterium]|nr:DUF896 domain-containing protein [Clostridia bacterium]
MSELTDRINQLAHKEKTVGLTDEEKAEQGRLRDEFRRIFRANFALQLENTVIETPDGKQTKLTEWKKKE